MPIIEKDINNSESITNITWLRWRRWFVGGAQHGFAATLCGCAENIESCLPTKLITTTIHTQYIQALQTFSFALETYTYIYSFPHIRLLASRFMLHSAEIHTQTKHTQVARCFVDVYIHLNIHMGRRLKFRFCIPKMQNA